MPPTTKAMQGVDVIERYNPQLAAEVRQTLTRPSGFTVNVPDVIPSTRLSGNATISDVFARRNQMEANQLQSQQLGQDYDALTGRIGSVSPVFANPEQFLSRLLLNQPTDTQRALDTQRQTQAMNTRDFADDFSAARDEARTEFDVSGLTAQLAETRTRIADRQTQLREDLRRFEINSKERGVARPFVEAERQKLQADATAELADLAIIEAAQTGNLELANQQVDDVLEELRLGFELENQAIEQEIARLEAIDTRESEQRSEQLQIALQERNRNIEQRLADEREKRELMLQAAANGADQGTLDAIRAAATPGEATLLAGPWIGRLDRLNTQSQISARNLSNTIELAKLGNPEALAQLGLTANDGTQPTSDELAFAQQYAATGTIPSGMSSSGVSFGRIAELARDLPKQDGTVVDATTGVKPDVSDATIDGYAAMYDLIKKSEELANLNEQRTKGVVGGVARVFGSDLQQQYADLRTEMIDLLARARTGAALTADEERFYKARLPGTMAEWGSQLAGGFLFGGPLGVDTTARIRDNFGGALEQTLNSKLQAQNLVMYGFTPVETSQGTFRVGEVITNEVTGQSGIINADGTVTPI